MSQLAFSCLLCGCTQFLPVGKRDGYELVECRKCALRQVRDLPSDAELDAYYSHWHMNKKYARQAKKKVWRWLPKLLRARLKLGAGKTFLDVGCNAGFACEAARLLGFVATGIEISTETVNAAKETFLHCEFHQQSIIRHAASGKKYDLVLCSEVIEHLNDVHPFLDALCNTLKPGGLLHITTPDGDAHPEPASFTNWHDANPPQHLVWFRERHLKDEMQKRGLQYGWSQKTSKASLRMIFVKTDT